MASNSLERRMERRIKARLHSLLAEPCLICLGMESLSDGICALCQNELPWQPPGCAVCGVVLEDTMSADSLCNRCMNNRPAFDRCLAVFSHEFPVAGQVSSFKDRAGFGAARTFGILLARQFLAHYRINDLPLPELLVPVPLHPSRLRKRGYNQAAMLTLVLGRRTGIRVTLDICSRQKTEHSQRGLDAKARLANDGKLFTANGLTRTVCGRRVAIIDDVVTTTATARDMSRVIRVAGANSIDVWALTRRN